MRARERLEWLVGVSARRPLLTLAIALAVALGGAAVALSLKPDTSPGTLVSSSSASYRATVEDQRHFGSDAVVILIREPLPYLVETKDLATVTQLEACLAGQVVVPNSWGFVPAPAGSQPPYGGSGSPCGKLMKTKPVRVVYGPGTFLNQAVNAVNQGVQSIEQGTQKAVAQAQQAAYQVALGRGMSRAQALQAAAAAGQLAQQQQGEELARLYLNSGIKAQSLRIDDTEFISQIVFDPLRGVNQPKARFAYLFPSADSAIIQVRLKSSLNSSQQEAAISLIRQAVKMPMFASAYGGTYLVSGAPVVVSDLAARLSGAIAGLLVAALLVMAATLLLVFRSRLRLLPLGIALMAAGITFGLTALAGATLTMASIAVLPILIGLAVDYAIQFQSRVGEARSASGDAADAVARAAAAGVPTIATAALATAVGFLVLQLSPVPMVRGFGLLLVVGIAVALLCALTAGSALMALGERREPGWLDASLRGAGEILADAFGRVAAVPRRGWAVLARRRGSGSAPAGSGTGHARRGRAAAALDYVLERSIARPGRIIVIGLVLAVLGWVTDTQTSVQSDITKLVPSNMPALQNLRTLERVTGMSGEIDVTVHARNVATPQTIGWMTNYEKQLLAHYGYVETQGCARATLCPALSLPDLFSGGFAQSNGSIASFLAAVPPYFSQAVISPDHHEAALAFGIRLMPLARQQRVIDYMRSQLHPPRGVSAQLAGLPVLASEADGALSSSGRRLLTLVAGLLLVGAVLMAVLRRVERAVVPLIPIALATGWSALIVFAIGIPLNPMSATLGALVIAISTEFSVLLSERFRQERAAGHELVEALRRTYRFTGAAVLASGVTAIAGFGVLVVSDITMLRDFGFVTLIDLTVSLAGVLLVLPSVLAIAERTDLLDRAEEIVRRAMAGLPRRRPARVA
jgi:hydrophobe/amphiphile efflux-3 (HAE3) family protein